MRLYDHPSSGNCLKARILLRQLGVAHETVTVDLFRGETRTPAHLARNPDGRVPVLELDDGPTAARSCAATPTRWPTSRCTATCTAPATPTRARTDTSARGSAASRRPRLS